MLKSYGATTTPSHCTIIIIIIIIIIIVIIIIIIIITIWKGYFSVNPFLSLCSFETKKSVAVDVVIAAKHL